MIKLTITNPYGEEVGNLWSDCSSIEKFHKQFEGVIHLFSCADVHLEITEESLISLHTATGDFIYG